MLICRLLSVNSSENVVIKLANENVQIIKRVNKLFAERAALQAELYVRRGSALYN